MGEYENLKLTYEEIKKIKKCDNLTEEEISQITETVFQLSVLAFNSYLNNNKKATNYGNESI